jgi:putative inorganic carbon (hco3(-)) transporter
VPLKRIFTQVVLNNFLIFFGLTVPSIILAFISVKFGAAAGILCILALISIAVLFLMITNVEFGFFLILVLSFFINYINRWTNGQVPFATLEIMMLFVFFGLLLKGGDLTGDKNGIAKYFKNPVTIALLIWVLYNLFQFLNPNSSNFIGKVIAIRQALYSLFGFIIALSVFNNIRSVKKFFKIALSFSLLAAIFGITQKYIGLLPFEREWLFSDPGRVRLFVIWGEIRVWSFLNDPTNFGLLMASSGLICIILMTGPYKVYKKVLLAVAGLSMFLGMVASGTRTAFIVVIVGFGIFGLVNLKNVRTQIISFVFFLTLIGVYFGPFYSPPIVRIRTAFQGGDDPSMNVRLINKERIRPYLWSHPIGGGPNTTGESSDNSHPLWGFPPDSGYLKIALELGYIGLILNLWLYYKSWSHLVSQYFQTVDWEKRTLQIAMLCSMIALSTAELTQITITQRPFDFFFIAYFAMIIRLKDLK